MVYSVARRRGSDSVNHFFRSRSGIRHSGTPLPRASLLGNTQSNGKSALFKCQVEKNRPEKPRAPPPPAHLEQLFFRFGPTHCCSLEKKSWETLLKKKKEKKKNILCSSE